MNVEPRPGSLSHLDRAVRLVTIPYTDARPSPTPSLARGEEGLEDARARLGVHAGPCRSPRARRALDRALGVAGLDRERAARRHRVAGVDGEVDDHLLELARVGAHVADGRVEPCPTSTSSPTSRSSIVSTPRTTSPRSSDRGWSTWRRPKASSCLRQVRCAVGRPLDLAEVAAELRVPAARSSASAV